MNTQAAEGLMQAAPGQDMSFFLMVAAMFAIFYFLVFRPQQKQQKEKEAAVKGAVKGDRILTSGGLYGTVTNVSDDIFTVEIARVKGTKVEVEVARERVESVAKAGASTGGSGTGSEAS